MALHDEITAHSNGAHFYRADLHIHSYGGRGSYDVRDADMTPQAIVDLAVTENLHVVSITDHNGIGNVRLAIEYAADKGVLVIPGVELSTSDGHLLVYFATPENLESFYGRLRISQNKRACMDSMVQCLRFAADCGGIGACAHVDQEAGLEQAHPKFDAFKQEILNAPNLLALEITKVDNYEWFSHVDPNNDRRNCASIRRGWLGHEQEVSLAKIMGSDSHALAAIGRNANNQKRLTRFKMESLTFEAFRVALLDCAARVRLEDLIPPSIPHFVGMKLEGGFLRDQIVHFSKNLTCIIGGRGAGKSTMLESLRVVSGNMSDCPIVDSEVWPDCVSLIYQDEVGELHTLSRGKLDELTNDDEPEGIRYISIESYGQGETAATIHRCDRDPSILLKFLDGFIDLSGLRERDDQLRDELLENQTELEQLHRDVVRIDEVDRLKKAVDAKVAILKQQQAAQIVEIEEKLATERAFRDRLCANLKTLLTSINEGLNSEAIRDLIDNVHGAALAVGMDEFEAVKRLVSGLANQVDALSTELKAQVKTATDLVNAQLANWSAKERQSRENIENIRRELEKQNIRLDIAFIRKITADATAFATRLLELKKSVPKKDAALKRREALVKERREIKSKMYTGRVGFATLMNRNLQSCVVDYSVSLKFAEGLLSPEFEEIVKNAMSWRTSQVPKAALIASRFSPYTLLDAIRTKAVTAFTSIVDSGGNKVFSPAEASEIIQNLSQWEHRTAIQRCQFDDRPEIKVTKMVTLDDGRQVPNIKDFSKLSLGQQQSILLTILLFSQSTAPLIIDQPEDNLDSEFVYTTLVRSLRGIKEKRQVIIVTHNANIAVLGDAELIIPLRAQSENAIIRDRGSIDTKPTKEIVCTILEGSPKAFKRRHELYGF